MWQGVSAAGEAGLANWLGVPFRIRKSEGVCMYIYIYNVYAVYIYIYVYVCIIYTYIYIYVYI